MAVIESTAMVSFRSDSDIHLLVCNNHSHIYFRLSHSLTPSVCLWGYVATAAKHLFTIEPAQSTGACRPSSTTRGNRSRII